MTRSLVPVGRKFLSAVVLLGFTGQLAWTVENMYLNVFVYDTITDSPHIIALMVAISAVAATLATLLIGALSDKVGTRRPFIVFGYVIWGALTAAFGFVQGDDGTAQAVTLAVISIVALDATMSFFGAGANDGAFNAWVTDSTNEGNRGRVDAILQVMPLIAMLVVFGALDSLTQSGNWTAFFGIIGGVVILVGASSWFLVKDAPTIQKSPEPYFGSLVYGLRLSTIRRHAPLYVTLLAWAVVSTSTQVFMPYLIIYIQRRLQMDNYPLILASVIIAASVISVLGGRVIDRVGKVKSILPATGMMVVGCFGMFFARTTIPVIVCGTFVFGGMMLSTAAIAATVRDQTPTDRVGMVQGLRMVAMVLLPMVIGPFVGAQVISGAGETYFDLGVEKQVPTPWIFVAAGLIALLVVVPVIWLRRLSASGKEATC